MMRSHGDPYANIFRFDVKPVANNVVSATILRPILLPLKRDCSREFYRS